MPRCCATINDPANPSNVLVLVEVKTGNADAEINTGLAAAEQAAQAAFAAANPGAGAQNVNKFTVPGNTTHITVDLTTV
jgi:hypothetical protein